MIKKIKFGMKILDYAHDLKRTCVIYVLFQVSGVLLLIFEQGAAGRIGGGFFLMCSSMFPVQMLYSLSISDMLQASPVKKSMQTSVPAIMGGCSMMFAYLLFSLISGAVAAASSKTEYALCNEMLAVSLLGVGLMLYLGIVYKYFVAATILFFCVYGGMAFIQKGRAYDLNVFGPGGIPASLPLALAMGAALIVAGGILEYLVSLAVYKAPMSKNAQAASLRREL